ncbi:MAG: tetratricopeptide repeat protein [Acidobacteria bacterium]|nr:tetratricopeptide repeat protein [Acidobacteriota bacterium]
MPLALLAAALFAFAQAGPTAGPASAAASAMKRGDYAAAERHNRALTELDPKLAEAWVNLGLSCFLQRKYDDAAAALETGLRIEGRLWNGWLFLGMAEFNRNRPARAIDPLRKYTAARQRDLQGHYYLGLSLLSLDRFEEAGEALGQARQIEPGNIDVLYHQAQSQLGQARSGGDRERLRREYETTLDQIAKIDPESYRLGQLRAGYFRATGESVKARAELEALTAKDLKVRGLRYTLACLYIESREYEKAVAELEAESKLDSPWPRTYLQLGHAYLELGRNGDAHAALAKAQQAEPSNGTVWFEQGRLDAALGDTAAAIQGYEKAIALGDKRSSVYYRLANSYRRAGRSAEAQRALTESERRRKQEAAANERMTAEMAVENGLHALNSGRYAEAADLFDYVWRETSRCDAPFYLGLARQRARDANAAAVAFSAAVECNPSMLDAHLALAESQASRGDDGRALAAYEQALNRAPDNAAALRGSAALYLRHEMNDQAVAVLEKLAAKEPGDIQVKTDLGAAYAATSQPEKAEQMFRAALNLNPAFPPALVGIGSLALKEEKLEQAIPALEQAVKMVPASYEANYLLGAAYAQAGRTSDALPRLEAAREARPDDAEIHYRLARLYGDSGRAADLKAALARFSELKARTGHAAQTQREVKRLMDEAKSAIEKGELEPAARLTAEALKMDPRNPGILFRLAGIYYDSKRHAEALPLAEEALALAPSEWSYHLLAGLIQKALYIPPPPASRLHEFCVHEF